MNKENDTNNSSQPENGLQYTGIRISGEGLLNHIVEALKKLSTIDEETTTSAVRNVGEWKIQMDEKCNSENKKREEAAKKLKERIGEEKHRGNKQLTNSEYLVKNIYKLYNSDVFNNIFKTLQKHRKEKVSEKINENAENDLLRLLIPFLDMVYLPGLQGKGKKINMEDDSEYKHTLAIHFTWNKSERPFIGFLIGYLPLRLRGQNKITTASYRITETLLSELMKKGLPKEIIESLDRLPKRKEPPYRYFTEEEFIYYIEQEIEAGQIAPWKDIILKHFKTKTKNIIHKQYTVRQRDKENNQEYENGKASGYVDPVDTGERFPYFQVPKGLLTHDEKIELNESYNYATKKEPEGAKYAEYAYMYGFSEHVIKRITGRDRNTIKIYRERFMKHFDDTEDKLAHVEQIEDNMNIVRCDANDFAQNAGREGAEYLRYRNMNYTTKDVAKEFKTTVEVVNSSIKQFNRILKEERYNILVSRLSDWASDKLPKKRKRNKGLGNT